MEIAAIGISSAMVFAALGLGVKGYIGLSDRMARLEAMQRLLLRKNGYEREHIEQEIERELHDYHDEGKRRH